MRLFRWLPLLVLIPALAAVSCVRLHGPEDIRRELSRSAGVELDREMGLTLTRSGMWIARMGLRMSDEDEISLRGVRRMQVGIYEVRGPGRGQDRIRSIDFSLLEGWTQVVRVREDDEQVFVLTREESGKIRGLLVIVAESDEWVLVRMKGKLDRMLEEAIRTAFDEVDRPDLYARTRAERGLEPLGPDGEGDPDSEALVGALRVTTN